MKVVVLLTICLFSLLTVGVFGQLVDPNTVSTKSFWCFQMLGFDYYRQTDNLGVETVNRNFYRRRTYQGNWVTRPCAPGVWFSIRSTCICDTEIPNTDRGNTQRCVGVSGNAQFRNAFVKTQRGQISPSLTAWVDGFENTIPLTNENCRGSNATNFRSISFFEGNSIAREDLDISVGFKIPATPVPGVGREYPLVSSGSCSEDGGRPASFAITYVTGGTTVNGVVADAVLVSLRLSDRFGVPTGLGNLPETDAFIRCDIPTQVNHPSNNPPQVIRNPYFWDQNAVGNYARFVMRLDDLANARVYLFNQAMATNGVTNPTEVPATGFCINQQPIQSTGSLGTSFQIAPRSCALTLGIAPGNLFVCITTFSLTRDCVVTPAVP